MGSKMGRPKLEKPLCNDVKVRLDDDVHMKLLEYCKKNNTSKAVTIRKAIIQFLETNN
jgi:predicted transcriptional regulator